MSDATTHLLLPYILAAQAQKHVTHNEALRILDGLVQLSVLDRDLTAPPGSPADGDRYIVASGATGDWAGWDLNVALWTDGAWLRLPPRTGWRAWVEDESLLLVWDGAGWSSVVPDELQNLSFLGVNGTADAQNRLSVKSDGVLFSHDDVTPGSGDVRVTLNKAGAEATASVVFQSDWSGRAEFGLAGDDNWRVKVSPDGATWSEAVTVMAASSFVGIGATDPQGPLHVEGDDAALLLGNALDPGAVWSIAPGRPGFYEDHLIVAHGAGYADPAAHRLRLPKSGPPSFSAGVAVADGARFASETSQALAHYMPFDGARGHLVFRGADASGEARFRLTAYYHDGAWHAATAGGWQVDADGPRLGVGTDAPSTTLHADGPVRVGSFPLSALPDAAATGAGAIVFVPEDGGGPMLAVSDGHAWSNVVPDELQNLALLGLGTTADASNPFSAKLNAALLTAKTVAEGGTGDLFLRLNKEAAGDDLGLTLQTGFSTRALVGLFGSDRFRLAVSADGSTFFDGLSVDNATGIVDQPRLPRFKAYTNYDNYVGVGTWTKIAINNIDYNDQSAFDAANNRFVAPVDGTYLFGATLLYKVNASTSARMSGRLVLNGATAIRGSFGEISGAHVSEATALWLQTMVALTAGDTVELQGNFRAADGYFAADQTSFWGAKIG